MFISDPEPQAVAFRNAAVCSASGSLSCASLWLIIYTCFTENAPPQIYYLPYIVSAVGYILLMLSPHSLSAPDSLADNNEKAKRGILFLGTALVAIGPIGSAWTGQSLHWTVVGCDILVSCLLLAGAAFAHKFARIY